MASDVANAHILYHVDDLRTNLGRYPQLSIHSIQDYNDFLMHVARAIFSEPIGHLHQYEGNFIQKKKINKIVLYTLHDPISIIATTANNVIYKGYKVNINSRYCIRITEKTFKFDINYSTKSTTTNPLNVANWKKTFLCLSKFSSFLAKPPLLINDVLIQDQYTNSLDNILYRAPTSHLFTTVEGLQFVREILNIIEALECHELHHSNLHPKNIFIDKNLRHDQSAYLNRIDLFDRHHSKTPSRAEQQNPFHSKLFRLHGFKTHLCNLTALMTIMGQVVTENHFLTHQELDQLTSENVESFLEPLKSYFKAQERGHSEELTLFILNFFCEVNRICEKYSSLTFAELTTSPVLITTDQSLFVKKYFMTIESLKLKFHEWINTFKKSRELFFNQLKFQELFSHKLTDNPQWLFTFQSSTSDTAQAAAPSAAQSESTVKTFFDNKPLAQLFFQTLYYQYGDTRYALTNGIGIKKKNNCLSIYQAVEKQNFAHGSFKLVSLAGKLTLNHSLGFTFKSRVLLESNITGRNFTERQIYLERIALQSEAKAHSQFYQRFHPLNCKIVKAPKIFPALRSNDFQNPLESSKIFQSKYDKTFFALIHTGLTLRNGLLKIREILESLHILHINNYHHGEVSSTNIFVNEIPYLADLDTMKEDHKKINLVVEERTYIFYSYLYRRHGLKTHVCDLSACMIQLLMILTGNQGINSLNFKILDDFQLDNKKGTLLQAFKPLLNKENLVISEQLLLFILNYFEATSRATNLYQSSFVSDSLLPHVFPLSKEEKEYVQSSFPTALDLVSKIKELEELFNS